MSASLSWGNKALADAAKLPEKRRHVRMPRTRTMVRATPRHNASGVNGLSAAALTPLAVLARQGYGRRGGQVGVGQHGQRDVPVAGVVAADLVDFGPRYSIRPTTMANFSYLPGTLSLPITLFSLVKRRAGTRG
jgi:hypothetical protein